MTKAITANTRSLSDQEKFDLKLKVTTTYFPSPRDVDFPGHLAEQTRNFRLRLAGGGVKEVALVVIGASDSGKSAMLDHHLASYPDLQPVIGEDGEVYSRVLRAEMPGTCSTKSIAITLLNAIGIPTSPRATEVELYNALKRILKRNKIECVVIDEMQHAIRGTGRAVVTKVQDVIKSLLQIDDWPIHFVFVGTHELAKFLQGDRQLANRCNVMRLHAVDHRNDSAMGFTNRMVEALVVDTAGLKIGWTDLDKIPQRVAKASDGALGGMIKLIKLACIRAIEGDREQVTLDDFAEVYRLRTGCLINDNIFRSVDWANINPAKAVDDLVNAN